MFLQHLEHHLWVSRGHGQGRNAPSYRVWNLDLTVQMESDSPGPRDAAGRRGTEEFGAIPLGLGFGWFRGGSQILENQVSFGRKQVSSGYVFRRRETSPKEPRLKRLWNDFLGDGCFGTFGTLL